MTTMPSSLSSALFEAIRKYATRPAIHEKGRVRTYAELGSAIQETARQYRALEINAASIVGVVADNVTDFIVDVFALNQLGAIAILLPADFTSWERDRLAGIARISAIISAKAIAHESRPLSPTRCLTPQQVPSGTALPSPGIGYLTSGTTGRQKLALRRDEALLVEAEVMRDELGLKPGKRVAAIVPMHHSYGFDICGLASLLSGAELFIFERMPPSAYLAAFSKHAIDLVPLVPAQLRLLAEAATEPTYSRLAIIFAGTPLDGRTAQMVSENLGCLVGQIYGTTETGTIAITAPRRGKAPGTIPSRHIDIRLDPLPDEWEEHGESWSSEGVVAVRSKALFDGYVTLAGLDRSSILSGWFSTGDCAYFDADHLKLVGRLTVAINVGGVKVSPEEIEAALLEFPGVKMALVTGVDDDVAHQRIQACVSPAQIDLVQLRKFCEARLSPSKRPHFYQAVEKIAATPSGKVIRPTRPFKSSPTSASIAEAHH